MIQKKQTIVKQGAVSEVMTHLSKLPTREKDPGTPLSLSALFRTKEYAAEIERALQRGYSFDDLAKIFTDRCGVKITARQLKYHHTREENLRAKGKKSKRTGVTKSSVSPKSPPSMSNKNTEEIESNITEIATPEAGALPLGRHPQSD